jgi:uncharacterized membrane protein YgaE (UPF0421/DUF939 family)
VRTRLEASFSWLGPVVLQAAKTGIAAGLAWFVAADVVGNNLPVFAPLAAVLTVQVTVWDSLSKGIQRALGVVVGVLLAYALARLLGVHVWSVALVVFVSWVAGQAIRLGQQGAVQVPVSALLVLVLGASTSGYAIDRVEDTFLGAATGIVVSLIVVPRSNLPEARASVADLATAIAAVLRDLAAGFSTPGADVSALLTRARQLDGEAGAVTLVVEQTLTATRWSPTGYRDRPAAEKLVEAVNVLDNVARSTRGIARVLADAATGSSTATGTSNSTSSPVPPGLTGPLADLLRSAVDELEAWTGAVTGPDAAPGVTAPKLVGAGKVVDRYRDVLLAARSAGISAEAAATTDAVAIYGLRISDDLRAEPDQPASSQASWRSLLGL